MLFKIQEYLKTHNLYSGAIDGKIGLETLRGIDNMSRSVAKGLQSILAEQGHYKGALDGLFGPASYAAFNSLIPAPVLTTTALNRIYKNANPIFIEHINKQAKNHGVTTKAQLCLFLANVLVESQGFNRLRENLNYKADRLLEVFPRYVRSNADARALANSGPEAIANRVYGGRLGNGVSNGDGWRYRGGGLIQTTGRTNYSKVGKALNIDLVNFPNRIIEPEIAVLTAFYYWQSTPCGSYADRMEITKCRKAINGGTNGLNEVNTLFLKAWGYLF